MSIKNVTEILLKYKDHPEFLGIELIDVNQRGAVDDTPLHIAARMGEVEDVEILIANGADVNIVGDLGNTPLHQAAMNGKCNVIKVLIKSGADLLLKNEFDQTPFKVAELGNHNDAARLLRKR